MRWNCPHCGTNLAIADSKLGVGWSFSKCYKCAGYGLVRKSDVNLIKVDRAPAGETILLPEASEDPTVLLSGKATKNLERYVDRRHATTAARNEAAALKPVIRSAARRGEATPPAFTKDRFPEPIAEATDASSATAVAGPPRGVQIAALAAGLTAVLSGIYLYIQGQSMWDKARQPMTATHTARATPTYAATAIQPQARPQQDEVLDQIRSQWMAPTRNETQPQTSAKRISAKTEGTQVRAGAGETYPILGTISSKVIYPVQSAQDGWYKIQTDAKTKKSAWVRGDLTRAVE